MDNDDGIAEVLARLIGLPAWLPKAILRTAVVVLAATVFLAPDAAQKAIHIYVEHQTERMRHFMEGMLIDGSPPTGTASIPFGEVHSGSVLGAVLRPAVMSWVLNLPSDDCTARAQAGLPHWESARG